MLAGTIRLIRAAIRSRSDLVIENIALRQQLAVFKAEKPRPRLTSLDRAFWVLLRRVWRNWSEALIIVKPETVVGWHRDGFRLYWRWKSRNGKPGRPRIDSEVRQLIRRMSSANPTWGSPRIHSELLKLGFVVSERTVARYMPKRRAGPDALKRWMTFLRNHREGIAAMDFFVVPTATFRVLYVLFVIHHGRRQIVHFAVTENPKSEWIVQQLREAFPFDEAPRHLIFDRDAKFSEEVVHTIKSMGIEPSRTAWRSPWQNGAAERWVLSARREMLDFVVVFSEEHLRKLLSSYVEYYHQDRPHLSLEKDTPVPRPVSMKPRGGGTVIALPRVGGLHHRYEWRKAA
jgi:transposase InsO family protein